jgi:hypothetical protein
MISKDIIGGYCRQFGQVAQRLSRWMIIVMTWQIVHPMLCEASGPKLTVAVSSKEIRTYDPLFLKVSLENPGDTPLRLTQRFGCRFGTLRFYVRRGGDPDFKHATTGLEGSLTAGEVEEYIPPESSYVTYERLFLKGDQAIFAGSGKYELIAQLQDERGLPKVVSQTIEIHVRHAPPGEVQLISKHAELLSRVVRVDGILPDYVNREEFDQLQRGIGPSELKRSLSWILAVGTALNAATPVDRFTAEWRLEKQGEQLDPVSREAMRMLLLQSYLAQRQWTGAQIQAMKLNQHGSHVYSLIANIAQGGPR